MSDDFNNNNASPRQVGSSYTRFSRSAGVAGYRRRRRQGRVLKWIVRIVLIVIIGGAGVMFGQRILEMPIMQPNESEPSESQEQAPVEEAVIPTVQPVQISLAAVGDVILNGSAMESGILDTGGYSYTPLFSHVASEIKPYDLRVVNQETNIPGDDYEYGGWDILNAPQELGHAEVEAGFNVILRANDHVLDNGADGLHSELNWWNAAHPQMPILGVSDPELQESVASGGYANDVYVFEKDGFKVAVLNHTLGVGDEDKRYVSALDEQKIATDVQRARDAGAEMIVAFPHWGDENSTEVSEEQTALAMAYANNGVNVIIGTHPRVLQKAEILHGQNGNEAVCFYSLGCFTSSLNRENYVGGLAEVTLSRDDTGKCSIASAVLRPLVTRRANRGEYSTYLLRDYNDELGQTGWDYLLPDEASQTCIDILGEGYNEEQKELKLV